MNLTSSIPRWIIIALLAVSFLGFLDATYLTAKHYVGTPLNCSIFNCEQVTNSEYSTIFNIPVALLGAIYYFFIFILGIAYLEKKEKRLIKIIALSTFVGFLASLWFVYLQFFIIKAICLYCMFSATTSTILFLLGIIIMIKLTKDYPL